MSTVGSKIFAPVVLVAIGLLQTPQSLLAQTPLGPGDPIAAIDGDPIYLGELNLILSERLKVRDLGQVNPQVRQATAALLVRRHLAMKSLEAEGGDALRSMIKRHIDTFADEAKRRGSSLEDQARIRKANVPALEADLKWRFAWNQYLKSRLTDQNLKRFFQQNRERFAGSRWRVSQIFLKMGGESRETIENAKQSLVQLVSEIGMATDVESAFATAAENQSDAEDADQKGGQVGWVEGDGDLPYGVMQAIRETPAGEIGGPVRSPLGLHLVYVHEKQVGETTFEELTDQGPLRRTASDFLFQELVRKQADASIVWFVPALKPPDEIDLVE